ncbi:uncharacterized protein LOC108824797 [Raphanus sativus]|uniref:Uncharacterized protein LOC108824797 n=1 Tax=Raphanus sativus TaxID=3726 RepID=A0A9W3CHI4_RAPSA|nr:uncharacterized protein LOC108824797 [Raphanus sativus]
METGDDVLPPETGESNDGYVSRGGDVFLGRCVGDGYDSCNFFQWYDVKDPHGWQHLALLEAWEIIREQKEEIEKLREMVTSLTHDSENLEISSESVERSAVVRNVLVASSIGVAVVIGSIMVMSKY